MTTNSNQNIITAIAIIVALAAVVYAVILHADRDIAPAAEEEVVAETDGTDYTEGEANPVVLTVDGREVTRMEIMDNFSSSGSQLPPSANMEQIFPLLQEQYLISHLLTNAARNAGIDGTDPEVAKRIEEAREQALRAVYLDRLAAEEISDQDVRQAYDDIVGSSEPVMERRARHILVQDEATANAIIQQLQNGADFDELARENSTGPSAENGGDLGFFAANEMVPAFAEAAFSLNMGEVSQTPVKTQFGYHVIKVEDERERAKPSFEEMREQIEQQLRQAVIRERVQELRQTTNVMVYDYNGNPVIQPEEEAQDTPVSDAPASETPNPSETNSTDTGVMSDDQSELPDENSDQNDATVEPMPEPQDQPLTQQ